MVNRLISGLAIILDSVSCMTGPSAVPPAERAGIDQLIGEFFPLETVKDPHDWLKKITIFRQKMLTFAI